MADIVHKTTKAVDHNRYSVLSLVFTLGLFGVVLSGCLEGKSRDPITGENATAMEIFHNATKRVGEIDLQIAALQSERATIVSTANISIEDANTKTEQNYALVNNLRNDPMILGLLTAAGLGGVAIAGGTVLDNRRKDSVIKRQVS